MTDFEDLPLKKTKVIKRRNIYIADDEIRNHLDKLTSKGLISPSKFLLQQAKLPLEAIDKAVDPGPATPGIAADKARKESELIQAVQNHDLAHAQAVLTYLAWNQPFYDKGELETGYLGTIAFEEVIKLLFLKNRYPNSVDYEVDFDKDYHVKYFIVCANCGRRTDKRIKPRDVGKRRYCNDCASTPRKRGRNPMDDPRIVSELGENLRAGKWVFCPFCYEPKWEKDSHAELHNLFFCDADHKSEWEKLTRTNIFSEKADLVRRTNWIGRHHSEETKRLMSIAQTGKVFSELHISNIRRARLGTHASEETRRILSLARRGNKNRLGIPHSPEIRLKIGARVSEALKRNPRQRDGRGQFLPRPPS